MCSRIETLHEDILSYTLEMKGRVNVRDGFLQEAFLSNSNIFASHDIQREHGL